MMNTLVAKTMVTYKVWEALSSSPEELAAGPRCSSYAASQEEMKLRERHLKTPIKTIPFPSVHFQYHVPHTPSQNIAEMKALDRSHLLCAMDTHLQNQMK